MDIKLSDKDVFTKIWASPRSVFKYINDYNYEKYVTILLVLAGIAGAFDRASKNSMGDNMSLIGVLSVSIIAGGLLGWISYYLYAALLSWTGKWIDGKGNTSSLLRMMAHAMIPSIIALVFFIPQIALFGNGIFQSELDVESSGAFSTIAFYASLIIQMILGFWTLVLFVIGISEVQKLSIGKSILNLLLPLFIIMVPLLIIVFLFLGFK